MTTTRFITGQTEIRRDWQLLITADMVLQRQGANARKVRARQPRLVTLAERAIAEGQPLIRPQVAYRVLRIQEVQRALVTLENGQQLKGVAVARKLASADLVAGVIATVGARIEREILRATGEQTTFGLALDAYATAAVGALIVAFRRYLAELAESEHLRTTTPLYPGTLGWELAAAQTELFSLVDPAPIGVKLTSSFQMTPCKSVSMLIGAGANMKSTDDPCDECDAAAGCRYGSWDT
jgi:hypothetical protein